MTPNQVTDAYKAILRLSNTVFPYKIARNISKLKKRLAEEVDTISRMEKAIVEKHGGEIRKDNSVAIEGREQAEECADELNEFRLQDDDIDLPVVDLSKYASFIQISPSDIDALEGLVMFGGEDDG